MLLYSSCESVPLSPNIQTPEMDVCPLTLTPLLTPALWEFSHRLNILSTSRVLAKTIIANKEKMMRCVWLQDHLLFNHFCVETEVVNEKQQSAFESNHTLQC